MIKRSLSLFYLCLMIVLLTLNACAKMGQPDGGWYDEAPPKVIKTFPEDKAVNVNTKKIQIFFDEYVTLENPTEKVVISPPQLEVPEIKSSGKKIEIKLNDSLKANTTYTVDFSDAIKDNNESNPLGNYTYTFSTSNQIDTLEVSGKVLDAENLEPIKGILVGLYADTSHVAFQKMPMVRFSRTDSRGKFVIKGVAEGNYKVYALQDADANFFFNQKTEKIAFTSQIVIPTFKPDVRQDTIWKDSLRIKNIVQTHYTHFFPDNIVLHAFTEKNTNQYLIKSERKNPNRFSLFFSSENTKLPIIKGEKFSKGNEFYIEPSYRGDTLTYWLKDSMLINTDSLEIELNYLGSDSIGKLVDKVDTLQLIPPLSLERRLKLEQQAFNDWKKKQDKKQKKGEPFETIMPVPKLRVEQKNGSQLAPNQKMQLAFETPITGVDITKVRLLMKKDTLWHSIPYVLDTLTYLKQPDIVPKDMLVRRYFSISSTWVPGNDYKIEMDSLAFVDMYKRSNGKETLMFKVRSETDFGSILFTLRGMKDKSVVAQLLNSSDKVVATRKSKAGVVEFLYLEPGDYYLRIFEDDNDNGVWDTGDYALNKQPEALYYYPEKLQCKAKWDIVKDWNIDKDVHANNKPSALQQQKEEQKHTIQHRNEDRAREKGVEYNEK